MKSDEFKRLKNGRIDRLRFHSVRDDLTPKQRGILLKELSRRQNLANKHARDKYSQQRINIAIYDAQTPHDLFVVASKFKNVMGTNQRKRVLEKSNQIGLEAERRLMQTLKKTGNHMAAFKSIRNLKTKLSKTKDVLKGGVVIMRKLHPAANGINVATFNKIPLKDARVIRQDISHGRSPRFIHHRDTLQRMAAVGHLKNPITRELISMQDIIPLSNVITPSEASLYKRLANGKTIRDLRNQQE